MTAPRALLPTTIGALGVVYGDIGTSPLYAFKEAYLAAGGTASGAGAVLGVLSLICWSLLLVVSVKYLWLIVRADNEGEGGILALLALVQRSLGNSGTWAARAITLGLLGTALFYCDALITPAISVLSAVEGLELLDPGLERIVLPATIAIIVALFAIQHRGTARVGALFGPIMVLWFVTLATLGTMEIVRQPEVLLALDPRYGIQLLLSRPGLALAVLGAVFLTVTGAEALYADMGHFGRRPVRIAWFVLVWPALLLNYLGQGALVLGAPTAPESPFYALAPAALLPALVMLATAATIIASQAVISGAFSITRQAVQLDLLPRLAIRQTSETEHGQIYVPAANWVMCAAVLLFVLAFGSSGALSGAYGASVAGTMLITTILGALVAAGSWKWPLWRIAATLGLMLLVDLVFVAGNATKIAQGGWVPLTLSGCLFAMFTIWREGRGRLREMLLRQAVPCSALEELLAGATRVPGTAVFLVSSPGYVPTALLRNLEHNKVVHERVIMLNLEIVRSPRFDRSNRVRIQNLAPDLMSVTARFGFMEAPDVGEALRGLRSRGVDVHGGEVSYFVGWHLVRAIPRPGWLGVRMRVFERLQRRSAQAAEFFRMPTRGVIVLATDVEL